MSPSPTQRDGFIGTKWSIPRSTIGWAWPWLCGASKFRTSHYATRASIYPTADTIYSDPAQAEGTVWMIKLLLARLQQGHRTMRYPDGPPPEISERFRGRPIFDADKCPSGCSA